MGRAGSSCRANLPITLFPAILAERQVAERRNQGSKGKSPEGRPGLNLIYGRKGGEANANSPPSLGARKTQTTETAQNRASDEDPSRLILKGWGSSPNPSPA